MRRKIIINDLMLFDLLRESMSLREFHKNYCIDNEIHVSLIARTAMKRVDREDRELTIRELRSHDIKKL